LRHNRIYRCAHLDPSADFDEFFHSGYILVVRHFFNSTEYLDSASPHKKAIVTYGSSSRSSHALTVAREKGILYIGRGDSDDFEGAGETFKSIAAKAKTGDIARLVLNGREGVLYKTVDNPKPLPELLRILAKD